MNREQNYCDFIRLVQTTTANIYENSEFGVQAKTCECHR